MPPIVVLHIPHSSRRIPADERQEICLDDAELDRELLRMTDAYTDELFPPTPVEAGRVVFPISRLICDVERFPSDEKEAMTARGMGVIYTRTSNGDVLRARPDTAARQALLDRWYWPHHSRLERAVTDVIMRSGICLIVDCHSFSSVALPYELSQSEQRADFCVGTDPFHTPGSVRDAILSSAREAGYSVAVDVPFSGALVPLAAYHKDYRVRSVMIEVNRGIYMDEHSGLANREFDEVRATVGRLIVTAAGAVMRDLPVGWTSG